MNRKRIREGNLSFAMTTANKEATSGEFGNRSDESEDEFFDCPNNEEDDSKHQFAPWNKPEGRLSKLNDMKLIDSDEFLYVPITQEPVPKTEDQLEDDAEVMLKLGPGSGKCLCICFGFDEILNAFNVDFSFRASSTNNECITSF